MDMIDLRVFSAFFIISTIISMFYFTFKTLNKTLSDLHKRANLGEYNEN